MRVYLDNCCYNRPFDPQTDVRICLAQSAEADCGSLSRQNRQQFVL